MDLMNQRILEIIREEIENAFRAPIIRRKLYKYFNPEVDIASEEDEDFGESSESLNESSGNFRILRYNKSTGEIEIMFPNGNKSYSYSGVSPYLYDKLKQYIKFKNNRSAKNIVSKFTKMDEIVMGSAMASGLSMNDKYNRMPSRPFRASNKNNVDVLKDPNQF